MTRLAAIFALLLCACNAGENDNTEPLLDRTMFTKVMLDVQIEEGIRTQNASGNRFAAYHEAESYGRIFEKHCISREAFTQTYHWYRDRPELLESVFEDVLDSLSQLEASLRQGFAEEYKTQRDSMDNIMRKMTDSTLAKPLVK